MCTFLTDYKHLHTILAILHYFNFKNFYNCFYAHPVNIWYPIMYSAH
jgi:hypothetical protein